jgi:hypothetical protein
MPTDPSLQFEHNLGNLLQRIQAAHHLLNRGSRDRAVVAPHIATLFDEVADFIARDWPDPAIRRRVHDLGAKSSVLRSRIDDCE